MTLTYAKAGGPPDYWSHVDVIDLDTGTKVRGVTEVDTLAGWLEFHERDDQGHLVIENGEIKIGRRHGLFALTLRGQVTDEIATAIHDAARLAQIVRANGLMIVNGVVYGAAGHGINVTFAAHTQALAQLAAVEADNETLRAENAALRSRLAPDDEGEFEPEPELIDAGDR